MAVLFFDTSALVRRYDWTELDSSRVQSLCRRSSGHRVVISRLTVVELASALNRKVREGLSDQPERDRRWRLFREHRRDGYRVVWPDEETCQQAERLLFAYPLRAFDALQIATALQVRRLVGDSTDYRFYTADHAQAEAVRSEALVVELIG